MDKEQKSRQLDPNVKYSEELKFKTISSALDFASDKELEEVIRMVMVKVIKRKNKTYPKDTFQVLASLDMSFDVFHFAVVDCFADK